MSMQEWAEREIEIACKRERGDNLRVSGIMDVLVIPQLWKHLRYFVDRDIVELV